MRLNDWLEISTEGFAQRQADRPPAHLVKELVQNALDATDGQDHGRVEILLEPDGAWCRIEVRDTGPGLDNPQDLRTVFSTGKEHSVTLRGRMGQGFKELLCLTREAEVRSRSFRMHFHRGAGHRVTDLAPLTVPVVGTTVRVALPFSAAEIPDLVRYFQGLLVPEHVTLTVNGTPVPPRAPARVLDVTVRTELFAQGRWQRRHHRGQVALVPIASGDTPTLFELGIPVQSADWSQPYHLDVRQRVPMNPRRDAAAAGYLAELHAQVLPHLLPTLEVTDLRDEWVSEAIDKLDRPVRDAVVRQALGEKAVRSVPTMGKHDWDADARELGFHPVDTSLLPRGLRTAAKDLLRSSRDMEFERRQGRRSHASGQIRQRPRAARRRLGSLAHLNRDQDPGRGDGCARVEPTYGARGRDLGIRRTIVHRSLSHMVLDEALFRQRPGVAGARNRPPPG